MAKKWGGVACNECCGIKYAMRCVRDCEKALTRMEFAVGPSTPHTDTHTHTHMQRSTPTHRCHCVHKYYANDALLALWQPCDLASATLTHILLLTYQTSCA